MRDKASSLPPQTKNILIGLITVIAFGNCIRLLWTNCPSVLFNSFDTGWIIRTGEYVLQHGVPRQDLFSWTFPERQFVAYQWLFEAILARLYAQGGLWLVGLTAYISTALLYIYLLPKLWIARGLPPALPYAALALVLTPHWFNVRPQLFSYFLLLAFIGVLEKYRISRSPAILCLIPPMMLFWTNVHLFWIIGIMLLLIYLCCDLFRKKEANSNKFLSSLALPLTFLCSAAMVFVNPYGTELVAYLYTFLDGSQYMGMYEVMPSVTLRDAVFVLAYLALSWRILLLKRKSMPAETWFVALIATVAALKVRRYESVAVLCTWPYVGMALAQFKWEDSFAAATGKLHEFFQLLQSRANIFLPIGAVLLASSIWYCRVPSETSARQIYLEGSDQLLQFVGKYLTKQDRLFNDPTTGDWLILDKTAKVFADTRYDMYPLVFCENAFACVYGAPGGLDFIKKYGASQILVRDEFAPICKSLKESPDWLLICDDGTLSFWGHNQMEEIQRMEKLKVSDKLIGQSGLPKTLIDSTIQSRCFKYLSMAKLCSEKEPEKAIAFLQQAIALIPDSKVLNAELVKWQKLKTPE